MELKNIQWKFATTYAKIAPHEYILQEWHPDVYTEFKSLIEKEGRELPFSLHGQTKMYRYIWREGYKYWLDENVLNREPSEIGQTKESRLLWAAFKERGIDAVSEYEDGHKKIDLVIPSAKLYIEVDGMQHFTHLDQVIADLRRDDYSDKDGFKTIRISNIALRHGLNEIADEIARQARERQQHFSS